MSVQVTPKSIQDCVDLGLISEAPNDNALWLSLRSLSQNAEMRFRLHRGFLGDLPAYHVAATDLDLGNHCLEALALPDPLNDWRVGHSPETATAAEFGHSLRCLNFRGQTEEDSQANHLRQ